MDQSKNRTSLWFGVPGLLLQLTGGILLAASAAANTADDLACVMIAGGLLIYGTVLLIVGLAHHAQAKGHHWAMGLFGCLGVAGLLVLVLLPDRDAASVAALRPVQRHLPSASAAIGPGYPLFQCLTCEYTLNGLSGAACPECGAGYDPDDGSTMRVCAWGAGSRSTSMATASLVLGIIGLVSFLTCLPAVFVLSPMAVVFGHVARRRAGRKANMYGGRGSANAGLVMGYVGILFSFGLLVVLMALAFLET